MSGLSGGDAICDARAKAAGLVGTFRAWLSTATLSASDRLAHGAVPYIRTDGVRIANDWADLTSLNLRAVIDRTETGAKAVPTLKVFTGTSGFGTALGGDCAGWTDATASSNGRTGVIDDTDDEWTNGVDSTCDSLAAIYCFQQ